MDILKQEVLEEQLGRRGDATVPLEPMLLRTLADIQERLTYRWVGGGGAWKVGLGVMGGGGG